MYSLILLGVLLTMFSYGCYLNYKRYREDKKLKRYWEHRLAHIDEKDVFIFMGGQDLIREINDLAHRMHMNRHSRGGMYDYRMCVHELFCLYMHPQARHINFIDKIDP